MIDGERNRGDTRDGPHSDNSRPRSLLTAKEVAELLGVTTAWVYAQSRAALIPTVRLGRYRRYRREAIDAWLRQIEQSDGHLAGRRQQ